MAERKDPGKTIISVVIHPDDNRIWNYTSTTDGPLGEWLATLGRHYGKTFNNLSHNATINVWVND